MGAPPRVNKQLSERYQARLAAEPGATAQRRTELWIEARAETPNFGAQYFDSTFSVDKTITLVQATATANTVQAQLDGDLDAARSGKPARPASGPRSSSPCAGTSLMSSGMRLGLRKAWLLPPPLRGRAPVRTPGGSRIVCGAASVCRHRAWRHACQYGVNTL